MKYICVQKKQKQKGNVGHIVVLELKGFIESYRTNGQ